MTSQVLKYVKNGVRENVNKASGFLNFSTSIDVRQISRSVILQKILLICNF